MKKIVGFICFIIFISCSTKSKKDIWFKQPIETKYTAENEKEVWGKILRGNDPELFYGTPLYEIAIQIKKGNNNEVLKAISKLTKEEINLQEPKFGITIGHYAMYSENLNIIKKLIDKGLDCNLISKNGRSLIIGINGPLFARENRLLETLNLLKYMIEKGNANVNLLCTQKNSIQRTPLIKASKYNLEKVKVLVAAGADPNFVYKNSSDDIFPESALISALQTKRINIVEYLIYELNVDYKSLKYPSNSKYSPNGYQILGYLRQMTFDLDSENYKKKMKLVDFLSKNGLDYLSMEIPNIILKNNRFSKEYLEKY